MNAWYDLPPIRDGVPRGAASAGGEGGPEGTQTEQSLGEFHMEHHCAQGENSLSLSLSLSLTHTHTHTHTQTNTHLYTAHPFLLLAFIALFLFFGRQIEFTSNIKDCGAPTQVLTHV